MKLNVANLRKCLLSFNNIAYRRFYYQISECSHHRPTSNYKIINPTTRPEVKFAINNCFSNFRNTTHINFCTLAEETVDIKALTDKPVRKTLPELEITLINSDDTVSVVTLGEARKISERRNLKLFKMLDVDPESKRPVYRLMTEEQILEEDLIAKRLAKMEAKKRDYEERKRVQLLILSSNISENDLNAKLRKMAKWFEKKFEVRVVITGTPESFERAENIYEQMEKVVRDHAYSVVQKRTRSGELRFQILPSDQVDSKKSEGDSSDDE